MNGWNLGVIGLGNMGQAIVNELVHAKQSKIAKINVFDRNKSKMDCFGNQKEVHFCDGVEDLIKVSDVVLVAIKPHQMKDCLSEMKGVFSEEKIFVSIAAGIPITFYEKSLGGEAKIIRAMANLALVVRESMTVLSCNKNIQEEDFKKVSEIFACLGKVEAIEEKLMNQMTALTGSSPVFVLMMIEAMKDAALLSGVSKDLALRLATQTVLGSAKLLQETSLHPATMKDQICSPSGTTIEAVFSLEKNGFRHCIMDAMTEAYKKSVQIEKKASMDDENEEYSLQ